MATPFFYRGEICWGSNKTEAIVGYIPTNDVSEGDLDYWLNNQMSDGGISPDLIVFFSPVNYKDRLESCVKGELLHERFKQLSRCKGIVLAVFDKNGEFSKVYWHRREGGLKSLTDDCLLSEVRQAGLAYLSKRPGVITIAPYGAYFRNPSQNPRSYFIRAGLMCRTSVEASFIAFSLLPLINKAQRDVYKNGVPDVIWVDTVSIAYIAYALAELGMNIGAFDVKPEIRSFSSYGGLRSGSLNGYSRPIFVISASTSGGLVKELVSRNGFDSRSIVTVIGAFKEQFPYLLYSLPVERQGPSLKSFETLREIHITGEDFLFSPAAPCVVELGKSQLPEYFPKYFKKLQGKHLIHYFKQVRARKSAKAFLIDPEDLLKIKDFKAWVKIKSEGVLPSSVRRIVYQNDVASKEMARIVLRALKKFGGKDSLKITSIDELESLPPNPGESVAVVAAVVGSGMELMRITKVLRTYQPKGSRFFLIGVVLARSNAQLRQLYSNLKLADDSLTYCIDVWCNFAPASHALEECNNREKIFLKALSEDLRENEKPQQELLSFVDARLAQIDNLGILHSNMTPNEPFISLSQSPNAFDIGKGFALWKEGFSEQRCPVEVLFTVACWLQNAREGRPGDHKDRLDGGGFQQTVISPECFLRFTDPVIQASVLRCAYDSELDYRSSPGLSARTAEIISKFIELKEESVIEFLFALVLLRLRVRQEDLDRIIEAADELKDDSRVSWLSKKLRDNPEKYS